MPMSEVVASPRMIRNVSQDAVLMLFPVYVPYPTWSIKVFDKVLSSALSHASSANHFRTSYLQALVLFFVAA